MSQKITKKTHLFIVQDPALKCSTSFDLTEPYGGRNWHSERAYYLFKVTTLETSKASIKARSSDPEDCALQSHHTHSCVWKAGSAGFYFYLWNGLICRTSTERLKCSACIRGRMIGVISHLEVVTVLALTSMDLGCLNITFNVIHLKELDFQHFLGCSANIF